MTEPMENIQPTTPKQDLVKPTPREFSEQDTKGELARQMMRQLASPDAVTVQYYIPGKQEPMIEREGADWERVIVLNSVDEKYGIAIHMLKNDPDWQSKGSLRMKPRGDPDQLRMVFLEKATNILGSVTISPEFSAIIATTPDHYSGAMQQTLGDIAARPHRGRIQTWEEGGTITQDPHRHVGTLDFDKTPPRDLTQEEQVGLSQMLQTAKLDPEGMQKTLARMQGGRFNATRVVDTTVDPFTNMVNSVRPQNQIAGK